MAEPAFSPQRRAASQMSCLAKERAPGRRRRPRAGAGLGVHYKGELAGGGGSLALGVGEPEGSMGSMLVSFTLWLAPKLNHRELSKCQQNRGTGQTKSCVCAGASSPREACGPGGLSKAER